MLLNKIWKKYKSPIRSAMKWINSWRPNLLFLFFCFCFHLLDFLLSYEFVLIPFWVKSVISNGVNKLLKIKFLVSVFVFTSLIFHYLRSLSSSLSKVSHLKEHKFSHGFGDTISPMCGCTAEIEDTEHFLLRCYFCSVRRFELFININKVDTSFTQLDTKEQVNILL